jgi:glycosyltransferase involved in cell wall biosynthesis
MPAHVSVIIATYNYGRFLGQALDSVLAQRCRDLEVLVVDDGSTDDTPEVVRPFLADARVRYHLLPHGGAARARNVGVARSTAPLVAFLDADDQWLPGKLEKQLARFAADPELGVVCARRVVIDECGRELPTRPAALRRGEVLGDLFRDNFICFSSAVVRRAALTAVGPFDESLALASEYELWLRIASRFRVDYVDEALVKYRVGHASLSRRVEERYLTALGIMRRFLDSAGGRAALDPALVRRAWAETYTHLGWVRRKRSRAAALECYLSALRAWSGYLPAWQALFVLPLPERLRCWLRRSLTPGVS